MAPKYILNYFDTPGRGEAIRLMFHAAGVEFTDNRLDYNEWTKSKSDEKKFPLGKMPTLQVDDNVVICQSNAVYRFVAREHGFYGENSFDDAVIDQVVETLIDMANTIISIAFGGYDEETKKKKFTDYFGSEQLKKEWKFLSNILKNNNDGKGFFVGNKLSLADITLYSVGLLLEQANPNYLQDHTELKDLQDRVKSNENIKKYLESQKK